MITKEQVTTYLKKYKNLYAQKYHIKNLGIFGSIARDENTQNSDLDVVVEFSKPNLFIQAGIMQDLKDEFNVDVDVIAISDTINPKLLKRINQDVIYV